MAKSNNNASKYKSHYNRLINKAKARDHIDGYFERHHIVPRCLGGADTEENIVNLTAREHFVAHRLLAYMHDGGEAGQKLWYAVWMMAGIACSKGKHWKINRWAEVRVTSRTYEVARSKAYEGPHPSAIESIDHKGNKFPSINAMVAHWGIPKDAYSKRINYYGFSLKDALEKPVSGGVYDHLGNEYESIKGMAEFWGIPNYTFHYRIKVGWSVKKALTTKVKKRGIGYTDHCGNVFLTKREMAEHWGLSFSNYKSRRKRGWSKKKSLTTSPGDVSKGAGKPHKDHNGKLFKSISEMARHWKISPATLARRLQSCWAIEAALTMPVTRKNSAAKVQ